MKNTTQYPVIKKLENSILLLKANTLPLEGTLAISRNKLSYLDISDKFINDLYPLLRITGIKKPNYFSDSKIGAHITVIYPEEQKFLQKKEIGTKHTFQIKELVMADIGSKYYYVLLIESLSLSQIRKKYDLYEMLNFKNYLIPFHITIGVSDK